MYIFPPHRARKRLLFGTWVRICVQHAVNPLKHRVLALV